MAERLKCRRLPPREARGRAMPVATVSTRILAIAAGRRPFMAFAQRVEGDRGLAPDACDFLFGNPQEHARIDRAAE
jgi:aspartate aminotransferase